MYKYYELYNSFEELFNTVLRGNEIEFLYNKKHFFILPYRDSCGKVIGVCFGEAYKDNDIICTTLKELYNARIENTTLSTVLNEIEIFWYNF